ncbi:MAG TPA: hypothetical protein VKT70_15255, partial [Stellaceae bacterium]|nr:hypothetical protein [Stellaceae bacterium]
MSEPRRRVPSPPHPLERRQALPGCAADPATAVPEAVRRLMQSPSYREGDQDIDFLQQAATRGARLQLDYLKPELLLEAHNVAHTIVVFGSTRVVEPEAARALVAGATARLAENPGDREAETRLAAARRLLAK